MSSLDFGAVTANGRTGYYAPGFGAVARVFDRQLRAGLHPGAQLVVVHDGAIVVDRAGGTTARGGAVAVTPRTRFLTYSISKVATAACIAKLADDGRLGLDDPVARHWPAFAANGKERITIRHVLLHRSGLSNRGLPVQMLHLANWPKLVGDLARQAPAVAPDTRSRYQILNFGFVLGELVHRIAGVPIDRYLHAHFLAPLGLTDTSLRYRDDGASYAAHSARTPLTRLIVRAFESPYARGALVPSASLYSTARDLAVLFQMLLDRGRAGGVRILGEDAVVAATSLNFEGHDHSIGRVVRYGRGFFLGGEHALHPALPDGMGRGSSVETFGHYGQRSSLVWADRRTRTVMAFLCNRALATAAYKQRLRALSDAVWDAVDR